MEKKLGRTGLAGRFEAVVCADEVACGKPAPDIFLAAADRLGHRPSECIVLEDSPPGVLAAHHAGMRCYWIPDPYALTMDEATTADEVLGSLHEVIPLLERELTEPPP